MAELPEIKVLSEQISQELAGKEFASVEILQEKCLNMSIEEFTHQLCGKKIQRAYNRGKWIFVELTDGFHLLLNLGMGADIFYYAPGAEWSKEFQCRLHFTDSSGFTCRFWWFGHLELVMPCELDSHKPTQGIAISPLEAEFTLDYLRSLCKGKTRIKNILLDQKKVGGIGNVYTQDILFRANIHPLTVANMLSTEQVTTLYNVICENLEYAYKKKGLAYEKDFYGNTGKFTRDDFLVGYKENAPCPICGTTIEKIKTGSTSTFICSKCQPVVG